MRSRLWCLASVTLLVLALPATAHEIPPVPPSELSILPTSANSVQLFWLDLANNESGYRVELRGSGGQFAEVLALPANATGATVGGLAAATFYELRVRSINTAGFSVYSHAVGAITDGQTNAEPCLSSSTSVCVHNTRFRVSVDWSTITAAGPAIGHLLGGDSAAFSFFNVDNKELMVKVLDGCRVNDRFWVFSSGLTNVEVLITVTDTQTGRIRRYFNPLNKPFPPVQDVSAFATCP
jgi:hypothetical protein